MDREIKMFFVFLFYLREGKILFWIMDEIEKSMLYMNICVLKLLKKLNMREKNMV